jgi:hypothetical protein
VGTSALPTKKPVDPNPPVKQPPVKQPPVTQPPVKQPPVKQPGPIVRTALSIAFAPPIDEDGWCAVIQKPTSMANAKIEFRYDRRDTGAEVTCFTNVKVDRVIEPLANTDNESNILALVGGQKIGDSQIKRVDLDPSQWQIRGGSGNGQLEKTKMGGSVTYGLINGALKCGLSPIQEMTVPDGAKRFVMWIKPDGSMNNMYARFRDESGTVFQVFLGIMNTDTDRNGWRAVIVPFVDLPNDVSTTGSNVPKGKLIWEHVLYIEAGDKNRPKGGVIEFGPAAYEF